MVEYLGNNYPLYFNHLEDAALKAEDRRLVSAAHEYLAAIPKDRFHPEHSLRSLPESRLYRSL